MADLARRLNALDRLVLSGSLQLTVAVVRRRATPRALLNVRSHLVAAVAELDALLAELGGSP